MLGLRQTAKYLVYASFATGLQQQKVYSGCIIKKALKLNEKKYSGDFFFEVVHAINSTPIMI